MDGVSSLEVLTLTSILVELSSDELLLSSIGSVFGAIILVFWGSVFGAFWASILGAFRGSVFGAFWGSVFGAFLVSPKSSSVQIMKRLG